jgi:alanyl-tRNA synthetase
MNTDDLREAYLTFFESKGCVRRPSDVLVPRGDPTVLFTPAGMNQFKREFLGLGDPTFKRATTCQKCLRTGDIENVGRTAYHHTFFEMLGNFSFGDYFKREAITWAWEFCTGKKWLNLPPDKLSVTVYLDDDEAAGIWQNEVGLAMSKITRMGEDDNFWPAGAPSHGPDGVCGPCSEIFFHPPTGKPVEIWNLVFTQFNRAGPPPGNLHPLPSNNIDTGMGLERTASTLQGVASNFDIDIFQPILAAICDILGRKYDRDHPDSVRIRRIADHVRAVTFCVHENVLPSNEKQGYVVRRLLRRAVLDGYRLGLREPFFHKLTSAVRDVFRKPYPELGETAARVSQVIKTEEERFLATLETGISYLDQLIGRLGRSGESTISGEDAFKLHATYGFPVELTESLAAENNLRVDRAGFDREWKSHVEVSGSGAFSRSVFAVGSGSATFSFRVRGSGAFSTAPIEALRKTMLGTEFLGYQTTEADGTVRGIIAQNELVEELSEVGHNDPIVLVLDRSPFYGESGGQVGDTGELTAVSGDFKFRVTDTQKEGNFILHFGQVVAGTVHVGDKVQVTVDAARRAGIRRAHTATHLLHYALHQTLGKHATQAGSKVDNDYLRFDFSHPEAVRREELEQIEDEVNRRVVEAVPMTWHTMPLDEAKELGAMALFGEKYGDVVRVVTAGDFSRELCGGTHLDNTGQIGLVKITSEESVAAGTRRIVALTGPAALRFVREQETRLRELSQVLKSPAGELVRRAESLLDEVRSLKKLASQRRAESAGTSTDELIGSAAEVAGVKIIARELPGATAEDLRQQFDRLRNKVKPVAVLLASHADGKVQLIAALTPDLVERGLDAVKWIRHAAKFVGGGGGGRPEMAQAGGKDPSKLAEALAQGKRYVMEQLELVPTGPK